MENLLVHKSYERWVICADKTGTLTHKMAAAFTGSVSIHAKFTWKQDEDWIRAGDEGKSKSERPKFQGLCH